MSIETQKNFLGKTQTILLSEIESERWSSWIRLCIGIGYSCMAFYCYLIDEMTVHAFAVQMSAILILLGYSGYYLSRYNKTRIVTYSSFILVSLDLLIMTVVLWSYSLMGVSSVLLRNSLFGLYFIAIIFTALHNKFVLSIYSGIISSVCYSCYYILSLPISMRQPDEWVFDLGIRIFLLCIVATVAGIISRKNYATINKVINSELRYQNLVHRLPEMLFTLDENGSFLWANNTSFTILGLPSRILVTRNIRDFMVKPELLKLDNREYRGTFQVTDFNGQCKFVDCFLQPLVKHGEPIIYEAS